MHGTDAVFFTAFALHSAWHIGDISPTAARRASLAKGPRRIARRGSSAKWRVSIYVLRIAIRCVCVD